jgi:hypothetical protein
MSLRFFKGYIANKPDNFNARVPAFDVATTIKSP